MIRKTTAETEMTPQRRGSTARSTSTTLQRYLREIRRYPVLSREEESRLARELKEGRESALDRLVQCNLRFVVKIANQYRSFGVPIEDLINEGNIGLMEAARRFDPERGVKFISWAVWWVRKAIRTAVCEQPRVVRLPLSQVKKMRDVRSIEDALKEDLGRQPTSEEISAKLPKKSGRAKAIHRHGIRISSLDAPVDADNEHSLAETLEDRTQPSVETELLHAEATASVSSLCGQLDDRQRTVISCRFGLDGTQPLTLEETGARVGLSRERVRQIESRALKQLRRRFLARMNDPARPARARSPRGRLARGADFNNAA